MWKPHPLSAALAAASRLAGSSEDGPVGAPVLGLAVASLLVLLGAPAWAQPVFSKAGTGTFTNINTPLLLNDAVGVFQTQGSVLCQAPQTGQLTSPSGVCMP